MNLLTAYIDVLINDIQNSRVDNRFPVTSSGSYRPLPFDKIAGWLESIDDFIFLESNLPDPDNRYSYLFTGKERALELSSADENDVIAFFDELDSATRGSYAAGLFHYETGYALNPKLSEKALNNPPYAYFGIYGNPVIYDHKDAKFSPPLPPFTAEPISEFHVDSLKARISRERYVENIARIKRHIEIGDTYQVNYTTKLDFNFFGSPVALYAGLRRSQPTAYSALIRFGDQWVLSFSPELFFSVKNGFIKAKPMKGTMPRGKTNDEDKKFSDYLHNDTKNRAENLMIVDLLRNDIGRISETGSVRVPSMFDVEKYRTVLQMTSTVTGKLRSPLSWHGIFSSMFPCGSVTGAPKLRTMEIIRDLEPDTRGVYTGAVGFIAPGGNSVFNVPIRTIELSRKNDSGYRRGSMGIGSGIVWDSDANMEYDECMLKARFLTVKRIPLELIESLRYENGYKRPDMHLERMLDSAVYFSIPVSRDSIIDKLKETAKNLDAGKTYKVRLTADEDGLINTAAEEIPAKTEEPVKLMLWPEPVSSQEIHLYHKTNSRIIYNQASAEADRLGFFDVIFTNERNEVTEGARTNVYILREGMLYTPPVTCGLLNGIYRRMLVKEGRVKETVITPDLLISAEAIYVSNSVRGLLRALLPPEVVKHPPHLK